jgi:hypothetical protein
VLTRGYRDDEGWACDRARHSGSMQVLPASLRSAGERARQISQAMGRLVPAVAPACSPAASAHSGWQFGAVLTEMIPRWEQHLAGQASAVAAAGSKLVTSGTEYTTTEDDLVAKIGAIAGLVSP